LDFWKFCSCLPLWDDL